MINLKHVKTENNAFELFVFLLAPATFWHLA